MIELFKNAFIIKFIKFGIVGFSGVFVDFGITALFKEKFKLNKYLSNSSGFITATTTNYILNRLWTFHSTDPKIVLQYSKFFIVAIIGLGLNNFIVFILNERLKQNFYVSKAFATLIVMFWNFFANYLYTF